MEHQHHQTVNDKNNVDDKEFVINYENILEHSTGDTIEEDIQELSKTPIPEIINDENENIDTNEYLKSQVDENAPQQQSSSSVMVTTSDDNRSLSTTTSALTTITTTTTTKADDRASPLNHHTLRENQQVSDRSSPVNGPGLAKPISMTSSLQEQQHQQSRLSSTTNPAGKKRIDAALEKNIETIVTQVRRTTTKPSQLTQNDLQLFDSTTSTNNIRNGHQSRETTPLTSNTIHKQSSSSSREMTPDSINTDSANEDQQQTIRNGHNNQRSIHHPSSNIDLTSPSIPPYGQQQWPPTVYPFAHQHPGLYLPYLSAPSATTSTPTNGLPPFYPSYDPLFIEQHYGPQGLSAFYNQQQQQQQQARLLQEHSTMSGTTNNTPLFRESQSLTDIFNNPINNKKLSNRINPRLNNLNEQQQMILSHLYLNQITSLPFVTLYENSPSSPSSSRQFRTNGDSDHISSTLTTPTKERGEHSPVGSGESIKSSDSMSSGHRNKKSTLQTFQHHHNINGSLAKLSPDLSSDGAGTNDADSIISFDSQKSNTTASMPVLEDGLSDSENLSGDEQSSSIKSKSNGRHQSTQSDFLFEQNHSSLITSSHKRQFSKSTTTNGLESQSKSFYIRPQPPPSSSSSSSSSSTTTQPVTTNESNWQQQKVNNEESSSVQTETKKHQTLDEGNVIVKPLPKKDYDTDEETDKLLGVEHRIHAKNQAIRDVAVSRPSSKPKTQEVLIRTIVDPENSSVLIEGVLFRCRYLGSTQLLAEGNPTKASRMMQAQEAVGRIKAPQGESQPSVEVDLFISTEKIMVLNTDLQDILMDHSLRSISYIADIGDLVVLMAKRRYLQHTDDNINGNDDTNETSSRRVVSINQKMICHVFESDEAQSIAHSIGQAFQVAYVEFLKANGIDDPSFTRDIDYQEVLNQQEIGNEELDRFSKKECQKEVIVPKSKNEPLGVVIVESGWGSMLPTVVIANMMPNGPAARCGHLNIGDQIISVNGISLVGLPLSSCQTQIKSVKHLTTVRLVVVPCPPVVEVLIRRPDTKYQLGFSVQNGIICSLLRGGIAERGGVRVGHRIIEINGQSVVATPHERIVSMLSNSVGELRMKTMPTQMYRLLTGQENPIYI
ncbi:unnamed protein product [Rotaria sp. Silwood2]|nr:unnamed protein product [Rotaria sp. Silwood2]CAF2707491.1 unnamed protein product [Rotaria sp. Silwood2]CAF3854314.1 unnamed protein product [Rotaria sp. Silwood2]CAF3885523.1 unnamed protein product [Rotaria sp. Silwood2]